MAFRIAPITEARQREERIDCPKHLAWVRTLPCCVSGRLWPIDAHHLLKGNGRGFGRKAHDSQVVPLAHARHMELHHDGNETRWFRERGISDPGGLADTLWRLWLKFDEGRIDQRALDEKGRAAVRKAQRGQPA